jgi:hypothetical protein
MDAKVVSIPRKDLLKALLIDMAALAFILVTPSLAHLFSFPVYMLEPMRLMMILSVAHSTRKNSYLLALSLPLFSFLVSGHPELVKMMIITAELVLNVWLFYFMASRVRNIFLAGLVSILLSKVFCYSAYLLVFPMVFVRDEAGTMFLVVQSLTTLLFSGYLFMMFKGKRI